MENGEQSGKKARAQQAVPNGVVKQEREEGEVSQADEAAGALVPVEAMAEPQINVRMEVALLHCTACLRPLKPPIFKCEVGHTVCCSCHGDHCPVCNRATTYSRCGDLDAFVGAVKVPCPYEEYGCKSYVIYYEVAGHEGECACAPCSCPEPGCGFSSSPAKLLDHFAAVHSWPVAQVRYGKPCKLTVTPTRRWHVLVGEEDRCMFLVSLGALGAGTAVSLVCVRTNGAAAAAGAPQFRCKLWVEVPSNKENLALVTSMVRSSNLSGGFAAAEQGMFLMVPPDLLHGESGEVLLLSVRIDKLRFAAAAN